MYRRGSVNYVSARTFVSTCVRALSLANQFIVTEAQTPPTSIFCALDSAGFSSRLCAIQMYILLTYLLYRTTSNTTSCTANPRRVVRKFHRKEIVIMALVKFTL